MCKQAFSRIVISKTSRSNLEEFSEEMVIRYLYILIRNFQLISNFDVFSSK